MNKTAICIKDGFMQDGKQFCFEGKEYPFVKGEEGKDYYLNSEYGFGHNMSFQFFNKYFIIKGDGIKYFNDSEFEI